MSGSARRSSTSGVTWPWVARTSASSSSESPSWIERSIPVVAIGLVSVMPQACVIGQPDLLPPPLGQRPRHGRPAAEHQAQVRDVGPVELGQHAHPDRRDAGGEGDVVVAQHPGDRLRHHVRAGHHQVDAPQNTAAYGRAPGVGVEHRDDRQQDVALDQPGDVGHEQRDGVQHRRAVGVDDALGVAGGARRVAHGRGPVLVVDDELPGDRLHRREELGVVDDALVVGDLGVGAVVDDDERPDVRHLVGQRPQHPEQRPLDEDHLVVGVVDDVDELLGEEPDVERVQHPAGAGTAK